MAVRFFDREIKKQDGNPIRFEVRLIKPATIRSEIGVETWEGLIDRWEDLDRVYADFLRKTCFRYESSGFAADIDNRSVSTVDGLGVLLAESRCRNPGNWWLNFLAEKGADALWRDSGPDVVFEAVKKHFLSQGLDERRARQYASRHRSGLRSKALALQERLFKDRPSVGEQYAELERALLQPCAGEPRPVAA